MTSLQSCGTWFTLQWQLHNGVWFLLLLIKEHLKPFMADIIKMKARKTEDERILKKKTALALWELSESHHPCASDCKRLRKLCLLYPLNSVRLNVRITCKQNDIGTLSSSRRGHFWSVVSLMYFTKIKLKFEIFFLVLKFRILRTKRELSYILVAKRTSSQIFSFLFLISALDIFSTTESAKKVHSY